MLYIMSERTKGRNFITLTKHIYGPLVHNVEEHKQVHGEQAEGSQRNLVLWLFVERLGSCHVNIKSLVTATEVCIPRILADGESESVRSLLL